MWRPHLVSACQAWCTKCFQNTTCKYKDQKSKHDLCMSGLQDLTVAGGAAAALAESSRQAEALRLLYNEELSRASRLAVELSRATAAADRAAAEEEAWRRQLTKSDDRADNAEGMAEAMKVTVKQLDEALQQEKLRLEAKKGW